MKTGFKVIDVMKRKVISVTPDTSVLKCSQVMKDSKIGSLLVKQGDKLVGIITVENIVRQVTAESKDPAKVLAKDIMATNIVTIEPEKDIYEVLLKMKNMDVRHFPVMDAGKLIGIITLKDVLNIQPNMIDYISEQHHACEERKGPNVVKTKEGTCSNCGDYFDKLYPVDGVFLCANCKDNLEDEV